MLGEASFEGSCAVLDAPERAASRRGSGREATSAHTAAAATAPAPNGMSACLFVFGAFGGLVTLSTPTDSLRHDVSASAGETAPFWSPAFTSRHR
ncbi:hypothetical protein GCM10010439_00880 [Actinocorallia aurantiaca]|uniref:Uncharacterized protein n=1 Tax=Actinocorallia aurantiaca TaxID=46204 RepID=A0ABP6G725_9ACTN